MIIPRKKVLYIEDSDAMISLAAAMLDEYYEVDGIINFNEGLAAICDNTRLQSYDALLIDLSFPNTGESGSSLIKEAQKRNYSRPIVLCSGWSIEKMKKEGLERVIYLKKPFSYEILQKSLWGLQPTEEEMDSFGRFSF
jgi:DNA-binding response OmpR family regulator